MPKKKIIAKRRRMLTASVTTFNVTNALFAIQDRLACIEEVLTPKQKAQIAELMENEVEKPVKPVKAPEPKNENENVSLDQVSVGINSITVQPTAISGTATPVTPDLASAWDATV